MPIFSVSNLERKYKQARQIQLDGVLMGELVGRKMKGDYNWVGG